MAGYSLHIASYMYEQTDNESTGCYKALTPSKSMLIA